MLVLLQCTWFIYSRV